MSDNHDGNQKNDLNGFNIQLESKGLIVSDNNEKWKTHPLSRFDTCLVPKSKIKKLSPKLRKFYNKQNLLINELIDVDKDLGASLGELEIVDDDDISSRIQDKCHLSKKSKKNTGRNDEWLAQGVFFVNFFLLIAKAVASVLSGSLSIISSFVDSATDLLSGSLMWWTARRMKKFNPYVYPEGRRRLEPVSIIILSVFMAVASVQIVRESISTVVAMATADKKAPTTDNISIGILVSTILLKIVIWVLCRVYGRSDSSSALQQDSRNDVLSNIVVVICSSLSNRLGVENLKYLDPCGAILIALYIIYSWISTGCGHVKTLTGHTASPSFLQKMTFIALNHDARIRFVDTVRAFHFGNNFLVEVDIVLDPGMPLLEAHDIGESLQKRIERLSEVERCFVHLDHEFCHNPRHEHKLV